MALIRERSITTSTRRAGKGPTVLPRGGKKKGIVFAPGSLRPGFAFQIAVAGIARRDRISNRRFLFSEAPVMAPQSPRRKLSAPSVTRVSRNLNARPRCERLEDRTTPAAVFNVQN